MDSWMYYLCIQVVQNLSIIIVCIPYIKSVLVGLESGMLQMGNFRLHKISVPPITSRSVPPATQQQQHASAGASQHTQPTTQNTSLDQARTNTVVESAAGNPEWDGESQSSQAKIIKRTTEWRVDYEVRPETV